MTDFCEAYEINKVVRIHMNTHKTYVQNSFA